MGNINITLPDGNQIQSESGSTVFDIIGQIGKGLQKAAVAAEANGIMVDLSKTITEDIQLKVFTFKDKAGKEVYWHTSSHLLAQAVKRLYPEAKLAIGPAIEKGFYYDIDVDDPITPESLVAIEAEMNKIIEEDIEIKREEISREELLEVYKKAGETYKVELVEGLESETVTLYRQGEFFDFCRGPHLGSTGQVKAVKLTKNSGAYWRADQSNKMLQRIYGISFPDKKELDKHLNLIEEAKERDHRHLAKELQLFEQSNEVGQGLVLWTPKGSRIRSEIESFWKNEHYKNGYDIVYTPHIGRSNLWETSGHLSFYKDGMYSSMDIDGEDYYVKPMNCPFHVMLYKSQKRSYRDLPIRWAEFGTVYRYEKSGTLHGLMRVRGFTQDDAHLFCRVDQMEREIARTFEFSLKILKTFGFEDFQIYLSTKPEKSVGSDEIWEKAESALNEVLKKSGMSYKIKEADGAFYGPKIDIGVKDAIGREWQLSTVQLDFNLPERFGLSYIGKDGEEHQPIMIHRALLGSLERFFGILIEHYKGAFPVWLSPVQVALINVGEDEEGAVEDLYDKMVAEGFRVNKDLRSESMGYKIRDNAKQKIPYVCVIGKKEVEEGTISVRKRGEKKAETMKLESFIEMVKNNIADKK